MLTWEAAEQRHIASCGLCAAAVSRGETERARGTCGLVLGEGTPCPHPPAPGSAVEVPVCDWHLEAIVSRYVPSGDHPEAAPAAAFPADAPPVSGTWLPDGLAESVTP
jgi:hypothetical protein